MNESVFGSWWRPGQEEEAVGGELTFGGDIRPRLTIFGTLSGQDIPPGGRRAWPPKNPIHESFLYGVDKRGCRFTLLHAECSYPSLPGPVHRTEQWVAEAVLEAHVEDSEPFPTFSGLSVRLHHLPIWAGAVGVDLEVTVQSSAHRVKVEAQPHLLASTVLADGATCAIEQALSTNESRTGYSISQPVFFRVRVVSPETWQDLFSEYVQPLEALLWLAATEPEWIFEVMVLVEEPDGRAPSWVRFHAPMVRPSIEPPGRELLPDDFLFLLAEMPAEPEGGELDRFGVAYPRWLQMWRELNHILSPQLARSRAPFGYPEDLLVTCAAALEAFDKHRRKKLGLPTSQLPSEDHKRRISNLKAVLDKHAPDLTDWAVNAAVRMNDIPFKQRLQHLLEGSGNVGEALVGEHGALFVNEVKRLRAGSTHSLSRGRGLEDEPGGKHFAARGALWILRLHLLHEFGFPIEEAIHRVAAHRTFRQDAARLRHVLANLADPTGSKSEEEKGGVG